MCEVFYCDTVFLAKHVASQNAHSPIFQQCEQPELIPTYDWQTNRCNGTSDYPEETSTKTYASFDKYDQEVHTNYGSFDKDDEELRMDVDGRWYTRTEFQVVCI